MDNICRNRVGGGPVAEVPESVCDDTGGAIAERYWQGSGAAGWAATE